MTRENKRNSKKPWNKHNQEYDPDRGESGRGVDQDRPRLKNLGDAIRFGDYLAKYSGDDDSLDSDEEE